MAALLGKKSNTEQQSFGFREGETEWTEWNGITQNYPLQFFKGDEGGCSLGWWSA